MSVQSISKAGGLRGQGSGGRSSPKVEVRDSRTGYLIPARDGPRALPDMDSSWDVAAVVAAAAVSRNLCFG